MFKKLTSFDKMITPTIIQILFWIGIGVTVIMALGIMFGGGVYVLFGLLFLGLGPIMVRVYCELLIVLFKVHESLVVIKENTTVVEEE